MKTKDWYNRQSKDIYVKKAKNEGFVSRSAFKLIEIEKRYNLIKDSDFLLELGSAPGGWTKVILDKKKNSNYKLVCVDLNNFQINLNEKSIFIKCDFKDKKLINHINRFHKKKFDTILSDMSPNTSGHSNTDHLKIIQMAYDILELCPNLLNKSGNLIIKIFQGVDEKDLINDLKKKFKYVNYFKPSASRKKSPEIYLINKFFIND